MMAASSSSPSTTKPMADAMIVARLVIPSSRQLIYQQHKEYQMQMTVQEVLVQRVSIVTSAPFDTVVAGIDAAIGHPDMVAFRKSFSSAQNLSEMQTVVNPVTQPNGLMEFTRFDLGEVLRKESGGKGSRILRVVAGNPMIMKEMVKQVVDAGSYAPVTILIEERADSVRMSYDRMVSYLVPYANGDALKVARALDEKVEKILTEAASHP
jgi:uncharacterized protein (DUF302 family)